MALIACPNCQAQISDQAVACPHCQTPLEAKAALNPAVLPPAYGGSRANPFAAEQPADSNTGSIVAASIYAAFAVIMAIVLFVNAHDEAYGGDAYTGIQNAIVWAVRGIAALLIGSGMLAILIATRRR